VPVWHICIHVLIDIPPSRAVGHCTKFCPVREPKPPPPSLVPNDPRCGGKKPMAAEAKPQFLSEVVAGLLPYLRRYARALTGSQRTGDAYAAATLEALLTDRSVFQQGMPPKVAL